MVPMARGPWILAAAAAAVGAIASWCLQATLAPAPAGSRPGGPAAGDGEADRLRREVADLRRRLEEARAMARAPAPISAPAPTADPGPAPFAPIFRMRPVAPVPGADGVPAALERLRAACLAGDEMGRIAAAEALAAGGREAADALEAIFRNAAEPAALRASAIQILSRIRPEALAGELPSLLSSGEEVLRVAALRAIVVHDPSAGEAWTRDALLGDDAPRRDTALAVLETEQVSRDLLPALVEAVNRVEDRNAVNRLINVIAKTKDRPWSAVQVTGAPDTPVGGDLGTAWASKREDLGEVWLDVFYARPVAPTAVRIRETLGPGAVARVLGKPEGGEWEILWEGTAPRAEAPAWFEPPLSSASREIHALRIVLDTDRVPGWSEIDAVELQGSGISQWAATAQASSAYPDAQ